MGPIEKINMEFQKNEDGTAKPILFVGENGTGKSTILSNIVDAFYEMAGAVYDNARESQGQGYQYYKAIVPSEIKIGNKFMTSLIEFNKVDSGNVLCQYLFKSGKLTYDEFKADTGIELKNANVWKNDENFKNISATKKELESVFERNVFCYFGPDRYEKPQWMGDKYFGSNCEKNEGINVKTRFSGELTTPISVRNVSTETLSWLLDIIVDSRIDIIESQDGLKIVHSNVQDVLHLGIARKNIEKVMSEILGKEVYFSLNFRSAHESRFSIRDEETNSVIVPTLDSLSTGQSALFNMFATIVRYADDKQLYKSIRIDDIKGIVVIDEIELHLHSRLQREVLPKLLKLFPKVQFIITTHSPLFLLGMDEQYGKDGYCIYQMPNAEPISSECFTEFENAYVYMSQTEKFQTEIRSAIKEKEQKTLLVTEGATDWRHLKTALSFLNNKSEEENYRDLDIEFLEYNPKNSSKCDLIKLDMSCSNLVTMCKEFSKVKQPRKIIFIADADDKTTNRELSGSADEYKSWGNNVYSMILPIPKHREDTPNICIEHYYSDDDLKKPIVVNGISRRIYMGNEFDKYGISRDKKFFCTDRNSCGEGKICIIDGQSEKRVFDLDDDKVNVALPKMDFAEAVYEQREGMQDIDFSEFYLFFDVIKKIIALENI